LELVFAPSRTAADRLGFDHWVYKTNDPRTRVLRRQLRAVYEHRRPDPLFGIADELEQRVLDDEYSTCRRLYPNFDPYSGLTHEALGIVPPLFPVMFMPAGSAGRIAQWVEIVKRDSWRLHVCASRPRTARELSRYRSSRRLSGGCRCCTTG
jgi:citrate synthase